jgi:hypothetical protein
VDGQIVAAACKARRIDHLFSAQDAENICDVLARGILKKDAAGGRGTSYSLARHSEQP